MLILDVVQGTTKGDKLVCDYCKKTENGPECNSDKTKSEDEMSTFVDEACDSGAVKGCFSALCIMFLLMILSLANYFFTNR